MVVVVLSSMAIGGVKAVGMYVTVIVAMAVVVEGGGVGCVAGVEGDYACEQNVPSSV